MIKLKRLGYLFFCVVKFYKIKNKIDFLSNNVYICIIFKRWKFIINMINFNELVIFLIFIIVVFIML